MVQPFVIGKADLHLHTTASDGVATVEQVLAHVSSQTDLRVIAITDHDVLDGALRARDAAARCATAIDVIVGEEVTTRDGHIIGLWLEQPVRPGLSAAETVAAIQAQGGLAVAAHPFFRARRRVRAGARVTEGVGRLVRTLPFDAIETINGTPCLQVPNLRARRFNRQWCRLPEVGGSDAHILAAIGKSYTLFHGRTAADLRQALVAGEVAAAHAWYRPGELLAYATFYVHISRARRLARA
ncbi:MAG: PHP domain-containing protein [Chloroflexi bacterium]|nr:PHP domain-containing protein [Chloroflexota bacterium]